MVAMELRTINLANYSEDLSRHAGSDYSEYSKQIFVITTQCTIFIGNPTSDVNPVDHVYNIIWGLVQ